MGKIEAVSGFSPEQNLFEVKISPEIIIETIAQMCHMDPEEFFQNNTVFQPQHQPLFTVINTILQENRMLDQTYQIGSSFFYLAYKNELHNKGLDLPPIRIENVRKAIKRRHPAELTRREKSLEIHQEHVYSHLRMFEKGEQNPNLFITGAADMSYMLYSALRAETRRK